MYQVDVRVHIILFKRSDSVSFLGVVRLTNCPLFLLVVGLDLVSHLFDFCHLLFVELAKLFLVFQNLLQKLFASSPATDLLSTAHLLFKAFYCLRFLLGSSEDSSAFVKVSIHQLVLV